jgi:tRNA-Thr(GGU) m(6)t(6)A37 methyltransferase TsaA
MRRFEAVEIGHVVSGLRNVAHAPRQPDDGAPSARLLFKPDYAPALTDIRPGDRMLLLTWLDQADRSQLRARRGWDLSGPEMGIFNTRSPDRPNPIGVHHVTISGVDGCALTVEALEAIDGTPILDLKPELRTRD